MKIITLKLISAYQNFISPLFLPSCRFSPSCSAYAKEAIELYGFKKGVVLSFKRILRCHPWGGFGHDPVPHEKRHGHH